MILDHLDQAKRYSGMHPGFWKAFAFLRDTDLAAIANGRVDVDGDRLFVIVAEDDPRGEQGALLESHNRYIDIQFTIHNRERIGWSGRSSCEKSRGYDSIKDLEFYDDRPLTWFDVPAGHFAIFYPDDVHAPLAGSERVRKAVCKIALDW